MEKRQHNLKYQVIFMWLYMFVIYVPFCVVLFHRHDVSATSLSVIAWFRNGLIYLILYLALTLPFCLYQLFFLNRHFAGNHRWVYVLSAISSVLMIIGGLIPLQTGPPPIFINTVHEFISVGFTIVFMFVIMITLLLCAKKSEYRMFLYSLCGLFIAALFIGFLILWTAALFQLLATLSFLLILLCVNTVLTKVKT